MSTLSQAESEQRERAILDRLPIDAEHVPNAESHDFDARLLATYTTTDELRIVGRTLVEAGTRLELKTCQVWIDDHGSGNNRRRGQWQVQKATHERLVESGGYYVLLVMDGERILEGLLIAAEDLEPFLNGWTNGGSKYQTPRTHISWASVIPPASVKGGGSDE